MTPPDSIAHPCLTQAAGTALVSDPRYLDHVLIRPNGSRPPEVPERLVRMVAELEARGLVEATVQLSPTVDPLLRIRAHHTGEHVDSVRELGVTAEVAELAVSGALTAVDAVADGAVRNASARSVRRATTRTTRGRGGILLLLQRRDRGRYAQGIHGYEKVVIIDWDYHHGNATQNAFYGIRRFCSSRRTTGTPIREPGIRRSPAKGPAEASTSTCTWTAARATRTCSATGTSALSPAVAEFDPDFVVVSAGFDSRRDDLLGCFDLTDEAFRRMTRIAMDYADSCCEGRLVSLLEGGYNIDGTALAAAAHVETLLG